MLSFPMPRGMFRTSAFAAGGALRRSTALHCARGPVFWRWLDQRLANGTDPDTALLRELHNDHWWQSSTLSETLRPVLMRL
jgi:hypothetical protein